MNHYAIMAIGSHQYDARPGELIRVQKINGNVGDRISVHEVMMYCNAEGVYQYGRPYIHYAVVLEIVEHVRGKKIQMIKMKRRKHHMKKIGHKQNYTVVRVIGIEEVNDGN